MKGPQPTRKVIEAQPLTRDRTARFPLDLLPPAVAAMVKAVAGTTGTDTAFAAVASLVMLAGAIGNRAAVQLKDGWTEPAVPESTTLVDKASIAAGVALARWFGHEARRVYAILSESNEDRETRRLVEWIERRGGTATVRDLTRGPREYRGDPERASKALGKLVVARIAEWVHDEQSPRGGRPTGRIRLLRRESI